MLSGPLAHWLRRLIVLISQVLVRLRSASVNPVDTAVRGGRYAPSSFPKVSAAVRSETEMPAEISAISAAAQSDCATQAVLGLHEVCLPQFVTTLQQHLPVSSTLAQGAYVEPALMVIQHSQLGLTLRHQTFTRNNQAQTWLLAWIVSHHLPSGKPVTSSGTFCRTS